MTAVIKAKLIGWLLKFLPTAILKRLVNVRHISEDFEIDLSNPSPTLHLNAFCPFFDIYLRVTNKSPLPVTVDRILFDVWIGQPLLDAALLRRLIIAPKETNPQVYSRFMLNELQRVAVKSQLNDKGQLKPDMTVNILGFCDSKLGPFEIKKRISVSGASVQISGA